MNSKEPDPSGGLIGEIRGLRTAVGKLRKELRDTEKILSRRWKIGLGTFILLSVLSVLLAVGYFQLIALDRDLRLETEQRAADNCEAIATTRDTVRDTMRILVEAASENQGDETPEERRQREQRSKMFLDRINERLEQVTCDG